MYVLAHFRMTNIEFLFSSLLKWNNVSLLSNSVALLCVFALCAPLCAKWRGNGNDGLVNWWQFLSLIVSEWMTIKHKQVAQMLRYLRLTRKNVIFFFQNGNCIISLNWKEWYPMTVMIQWHQSILGSFFICVDLDVIYKRLIILFWMSAMSRCLCSWMEESRFWLKLIDLRLKRCFNTYFLYLSSSKVCQTVP